MTTMTTAEERRSRSKAGKALAALPSYHPHIPVADIDRILTDAGFDPLEEAIYCGRDGRATAQVGPRTWLALSWHRMEVTGCYEIVAYLS